MSAELKSSGPGKEREPDTRCIELDARGELEYWLKVFDTTQQELVDAIAAVGPYAGAVAIHLGRAGSRRRDEG